MSEVRLKPPPTPSSELADAVRYRMLLLVAEQRRKIFVVYSLTRAREPMEGANRRQR